MVLCLLYACFTVQCLYSSVTSFFPHQQQSFVPKMNTIRGPCIAEVLSGGVSTRVQFMDLLSESSNTVEIQAKKSND